MATNYVNVASLVPDQHHCNLRLRVLSVEIIAETIHPETGKILQSAEAIVGDDTACILLNLKNDQVNLLSRNARLILTNAHVNMYRGFMRLEVNEDEDNENSVYGKPSITAIMDDDDDDDNLGPVMGVDGDKLAMTSSSTSASNIGTSYRMSSGWSAMATMASGSSSNSLSSNASSVSSVSRDQMEVEMRLGTGGSVPLMEYYRTIEFTYFSTVEPVGR
ncbi:hypothetical protein BG006_002211 [Podila minutissima]|uniref:Single-stranded DNA binding protein Ssb-like OB fold domain-containing protein n=1 Tax=Podila minutissima TaxID=64525 RepID=A0A9P5SWA5_9FUNG|nr:hypothetical protein BG006_002211 [Podila minutissima]